MYLRSNDTGNGRFEKTASSAAKADTAPRGGGAWSGFATGRNERHTTNRKLKGSCRYAGNCVSLKVKLIDNSGEADWYSSESFCQNSTRQLQEILISTFLEDIVELVRGMSEGERAVTTPRIGWRKLTDPGD